MTSRPRLIALDIDGTLLSSRGSVLPGTRAELTRAHDAGATIVLASGRPVAGLRSLLRRVRLDLPGMVLIGVNGAVTLERASGDILARHRVDSALVARIVALCAQHDILAMLCDGDRLVVDRPQDPQVIFEAEGNDLQIVGVDDLGAAITAAPDPGRADPIHVDKVLMFADPARLRPFAELFGAAVGEEVEHSFSAPFYFEATAAGVDKGRAVLDLATARGLTAQDCVAFGDNGNDLPMLRAVGIGVAMGNATAAVRAEADRVTETNDEEGIAAVLAELFGAGQAAPPQPEPDGVEQIYALDLREIGGLVHPDDA